MTNLPREQKNFNSPEEIKQSYSDNDLQDKLSALTLDIFNVDYQADMANIVESINNAINEAATTELGASGVETSGLSEEELIEAKLQTKSFQSLQDLPMASISSAVEDLKERFPDAPDVAIVRKFVDMIDQDIPNEIKHKEYLPMVLNREVMPNSIIGAKWNKLSDLPGHQSNLIRNMGRLVFDTYIKEAESQMNSNSEINEEQGAESVEKMKSGAELFNTAEVITISNFTGAESKDLNSIAHWITTVGNPKNGFSNMPVKPDYSKVIPGYEPEVLYYEMGNLDFKIVNDHMGQYIYAWENGTGGQKLAHTKELENSNVTSLNRRRNRP